MSSRQIESCFEIEREESISHIKLSPKQHQIVRDALIEFRLSKRYSSLSDSYYPEVGYSSQVLWNCPKSTWEKIKSYGLARYIENWGYYLTPLAEVYISEDLSADIIAEYQNRYYKHVCPKCDGTGYIRQYSHISGGICFHCNGRGKVK